jgi:hypothetical protein
MPQGKDFLAIGKVVFSVKKKKVRQITKKEKEKKKKTVKVLMV